MGRNTHPNLPATAADRRRTLRRLDQHATTGRLVPHEYDQRVESALSAATLDALRALTADMPDRATEWPPLTVRTLATVALLSIAVLAALFAMDIAGGSAGLAHALAKLTCW